jgi:hypothetical protein
MYDKQEELKATALLRMIAKLKEEGLWDSLVSEGEMVPSPVQQPSPAATETSSPADESSTTNESTPAEEAVAQELSSFSHELSKGDLQHFLSLEQRKCFQLDLEFSGDQFEGMTCFVVCSIHSLKRDLQAVGHGMSKVNSDIGFSQKYTY